MPSDNPTDEEHQTGRLEVGIAGTFDVHNYGDLLFPLIAQHELSCRLGDVTVTPFSYHSMDAPEWPFKVESLVDLPERAPQLATMLIGGGHVIRFDKAIAPGYLPPEAIHHPTGYWLTPALIAQHYGVPVAWNAAAAHGPVPDWAGPLLEQAIKESAYVAVRDEPTRAALAKRADGAVEIALVPDTVLGLRALVDPQAPSAALSGLRARLGLAGDYVAVQGRPSSESLIRRLLPDLGGVGIVGVEIGPALGDDATAVRAWAPHAAVLETWVEPLLLAELLGQARALVGESLHLALTGLALGVPVLRPAEQFGGKYVILERPEVFRAGDRGPLPSAFLELLRAGARRYPPVDDSAGLAGHWDRIAALAAVRQIAADGGEGGRYWQALPAELEAAAALEPPEQPRSWFRRRAAALAARTSMQSPSPRRHV